jgi:hypothetical protein
MLPPFQIFSQTLKILFYLWHQLIILTMSVWLKSVWTRLFQAEREPMYAVVEVRTCYKLKKLRPARFFLT